MKLRCHHEENIKVRQVADSSKHDLGGTSDDILTADVGP